VLILEVCGLQDILELRTRRRVTVNDEGGITESAGVAAGDSDRNWGNKGGSRDDGALWFVGTLLRYAMRYQAVKFILPVSCH